MFSRLGSVPLCILALFFPSIAFAQTVQGDLVEQGTGERISGATVLLIDEQGEQRAGVLTDGQGRFRLQAPEPGRYRLRGERIGYASALSEVFELRPGEIRDEPLIAPVEAISLQGVMAQGKGRRRCVEDPTQELQIATVWEEVRKALRATAISEEQQGVRASILRYERELDTTAVRVQKETVRVQTGLTTKPFTATPIATLVEHGWVQPDGEGALWHGPDAEVLLSPGFSRTHCFQIETRPNEGQVGLAFEPVRKRKLPDIQGTLWLDRESAELQHVEYSYVNLPGDVPTERSGGRMEFRRLPELGWIVQRWWIRMPRSALEAGYVGGRFREQPVLIGYKQDGGEVLAAAAPGGQLFRTERAVLEGEVWDSIQGAPLANAIVLLLNTPYATTADAGGRFRMEDLPEGEYALSFRHPRLDSLGWMPAPRPVVLRRGETVRELLAIGEQPLITAAGCPEASDEEGSAERLVALTGYVRDAAGAPVADAVVTLVPRFRRVTGEYEHETTTDAEGGYRICSLPAGLSIVLQATVGERASDALRMELPLEAAVRRDLEIHPEQSEAPSEPRRR